MSVLTQGTNIYFLDLTASGGPAVVRVKGATAHNPGGNPAGQIDDTDLDETKAKQYKRGLQDPGQASLTIKADPAEPSHIRLHELLSGPEIVIAVGWADGTDAPEVNTEGNGFNFPNTRTWYTYSAYVADFPFDFQSEALVNTQISLQRSGAGKWIKKGATP